MSPSRSISLAFLLFLVQIFAFIAQGSVPASATFKYVNFGEFGENSVEYVPTYRFLDIFSYPYQLCFYNTTPHDYYLALRAGTRSSNTFGRWVFEFNRGNPVGENATFSLGTDGNLVLANADGRVAWQSGTANKGVVGFELLPTGNMVLRDGKGKFIWQSFDYPTDTLLIGQSLRRGGPTTLVSRAAPLHNVEGPYSLVLEPQRLGMYYKGKNSPKPQLYFGLNTSSWGNDPNGILKYVNFSIVPFLKFNTTPEVVAAYDILLNYDTTNSFGPGGFYVNSIRYNATVTYFRLGMDGTFKGYTYDQEATENAWEVTFDLFSWSSSAGKCLLPDLCGNFGLCNEGHCVACPSPKGLLGWSNKCKPPKVSSCAVKDAKYYKLAGVEHFITKYTKGDGPLKETDCSRKCTLDCKCAGYFYHKDNSTCWTANDLMTLTKVSDKSHVGYIKY